MRAFIVRPFNTQEGIDFDRVQAELIDPALAAVKVPGDTTQEIARAGNIRVDMFEQIATADLVIADISIHNANVFYELGVRHALRDKRTFLIRAKLDKKTPFDLQTDRYLEYDHTAPAGALPALIKGLRQTLDSDVTDSPVVDLLQLNKGLISSEVARLLAPPDDFREEVHRAEKESRRGDLSLLSEEAGLLAWEREGLRRVGNAQFTLASWEPARVSWERIRGYDAKDVEANGRLATIHQKLGNLTDSDLAVERVLSDQAIRGPQRAEVRSLHASNLKTRWLDAWKSIADDAARQQAALESTYLADSYEAYADAFVDDRNHFYSGLNALAMLTILLSLGERYPDVWAATYTDRDDDADARRRRWVKAREKLLTGVDLAMDSAQRAVEFSSQPDRWIEISKADHEFLAAASPNRVAAAYRRALEGAQRFHFTAARRQLELFQSLGIQADGVAAALAVIDALVAKLPPDATGAAAPNRILLFTGHRLDAPGRAQPRFPAAAESEARRMIAEAIDRERANVEGPVIGLAGGASGGDILFHELCVERGIATAMYILCSREAYVAASVTDGGDAWIARYDKLAAKLPVRILGNSEDGMNPPRWLRSAKNYSVWERSNRWMLHNALVYGAPKVTLIALWNGEKGDGPGGTQHMVETAKLRGARAVVLDAKPLAKL